MLESCSKNIFAIAKQIDLFVIDNYPFIIDNLKSNCIQYFLFRHIVQSFWKKETKVESWKLG